MVGPGRQLSKATVPMSLSSIWKCWDPQTLHRRVLLRATAGPLLAAPTYLNLPGASITEDPAPSPQSLSPSLSWFWVELGEACPPLPHTVNTSVGPKDAPSVASR